MIHVVDAVASARLPMAHGAPRAGVLGMLGRIMPAQVLLAGRAIVMAPFP